MLLSFLVRELKWHRMKIDKPHLILALLLIMGLVFRLGPIWGNNFSYMYDNAKDQLVIMEMGIHKKPALVGPITSIDGVFNGPLWYYVALPANVLFDYHPLASVLTVIGLSVASIFLIYKYIGWFAALLYVASVGLIGSQQSAWTPYMTPFVTLPVLLILLSLKEKSKLFPKQIFGLFFLTGLSFHLQTAYGVVLLFTVTAIVMALRLQLSRKDILLALFAFIVTFSPYGLFEIRHNFHQTRQVLNYISHFSTQSSKVQPNQTGFNRVTEIGKYITKIAGGAVLPINLGSRGKLMAGLLIIGGGGWYLYSQNKRSKRIVYLLFILTPLVMYQLLPAKSYYFVSLLPVFLVLTAQTIEHMLPKRKALLAYVIVAFALLNLFQGIKNYESFREKDSFLLAPKLSAIKQVYRLSTSADFASYHFVPEVYDYTYQSLFLYLIGQGYSQPSEFSYVPGESAYMPQKKAQSSTPANETFLIVEKYTNQEVFNNWWGRVTQDLTITDEYQVNEAIRIYRAQPN
jgi:hypothetical protein